MLRIGVLASHQGTNFQAIADACAEDRLDASIVTLICNNSDAAVLKRAARVNVAAHHMSSTTHPGDGELDAAICSTLVSAGAELVVLAGYMRKLGPRVLGTFKDRIINVHPSLLPKYGGKGFYGLKVHETVIANGDTETGATVHLVTGEYDDGDILKQEAINVEPGETAASLASRVHEIEYHLLLSTIEQFSRKEKS